MEGRIEGWINRWMDRQMDEWMVGWTNGWMDHRWTGTCRWMDGRIKGKKQIVWIEKWAKD